MRKTLGTSLLAMSLLFTMFQMPVDAKTAVTKTTAQQTVKSSAKVVKKKTIKKTVKKSTTKKVTPKVKAKKAASRSFDLQKDANSLISLGSSLVGIRYKAGGMSPKGFDCSGFTSYVFKTALGITLPRTSIAQSKYGTAVEKKNLRPGDILYFNTSGGPVNHVGIYIGNGKFMHSSSGSTYSVTITSLSKAFYVNCYRGARRVIE